MDHSPQYAKLFCLHFFKLDGQRLKLELQSILFVAGNVLSQRLGRYDGTWPVILQ